MNPKIAKKGLYTVNLEVGKEYRWCACGQSKEQPFCDDSHVGTEFLPLPFIAEKDGRHFMCGCKQSKKPPFCDFTHTTL